MTIQDLETTIKKHMLLADPGIIKLICAFIIAARLKMNPPWLFIVGASSGGKSMLLKALETINGIRPLDDLTANTLASGMRKQAGTGETSLIDKIKAGDILTFKDFTTIISKDKESRSAIIGQLRKIYDGDFNKTYGNGKTINWKGRVAILAGVTSSVYTTMQQFADMGERFLMYVFQQPSRMELAMLSTQPKDIQNIEDEMRKAFKTFIDGIKIPEKTPELDEDTKKEIAVLAEFSTRVRSKIERNMYSREKEMQQKHFLEMPGRFTTQIMAIGTGLMIINGDGKLTTDDRKILQKLALDSIPNIKRVCLQELTRYTKVETAGLAVKIRYPANSIRTHLQDLAALDVIDWFKGKGNRDKWQIKDDYRAILAKYDGIELANEILQASEESDDGYLAQSDDPGPAEPEFMKPEPNPQTQKALDILGGEIIG